MLTKKLSLPLVKEAVKSKSKLPADTYKDLLEPIRVPYSDSKHIIITTKRTGELGLLSCDIRWFATTEHYEGFTQKGITFPAKRLDEVIEALTSVQNDLKALFPKDLAEDDDEDEPAEE